jgi:SNF2 family DNA or RNA helicase
MTTVAEINREIAVLRDTLAHIDRQKVSLEEETKRFKSQMNEEITPLQGEIQRISDRLRLIRADWQEKITNLEREKIELMRRASSTTISIEEKQKLASELAQNEGELERLKRIEAIIERLVGDWSAYTVARPYQKECVIMTVGAFLDGMNGMFIADDLGLGKTLEAEISLRIIELLFIEKHGRPPSILWLTKKNLVESTPDELRHWWPERTIVGIHNVPNKSTREFLVNATISAGGLLLTNYEGARTTKLIQENKWDILVVDEAHKLAGGANASGPTQVWQTVKDMSAKTDFIILMSATPIQNRAEDMWAYLNVFSPEKFPDKRQFKKDFRQVRMVAGQLQEGINIDKLLTGALKGQMIRRRKDEVAIQVPPLDMPIVKVEMLPKQAKLYDAIRDRFFVWIDEQEGKALTTTAIIAQLTRLRQISNLPYGIKQNQDDGTEIFIDLNESGKLDEAMDLIEDMGEEACIIACNFNEPLFELERRLSRVGVNARVLTSETSKMSGQWEKDFQNGEFQIYLMNSAMGEGLNLHKNPSRWEGGAHYGIMLDRWWSPVRNNQVVGRIVRPDAPNPVTFYNMFSFRNGKTTIDHMIQDILDEKTAEAESITESDKVRPASEWREYLEGRI